MIIDTSCHDVDVLEGRRDEYDATYLLLRTVGQWCVGMLLAFHNTTSTSKCCGMDMPYLDHDLDRSNQDHLIHEMGRCSVSSGVWSLAPSNG